MMWSAFSLRRWEDSSCAEQGTAVPSCSYLMLGAHGRVRPAGGKLATISPSVRMVDPKALEALLGEVLGRLDFFLAVVRTLVQEGVLPTDPVSLLCCVPLG